jgi:hypothetical protein
MAISYSYVQRRKQVIDLKDIEVLMNEEWILSKATDDFLRLKSIQKNDSSECEVTPSQSDDDLIE